MAVYIFAARIYLDSDPTVANASDIGLYDDADNGTNQVFRLIESDISSYSPTYTWKTGVLTPAPFDDISESVDLALGGNLPSVGGTNIRIPNTLSIGGTMTQFDKTVEAADIRFNGLRCDIIRFEVSSGSLVSADGDIVFRGICGDPTWDERIYTIPVENSLFKREANLATIISSENYPNATDEIVGQVVPVTFGEFVPEFDVNNNPEWSGYAEFKRTANKQKVEKITIQYPTGLIIAGDELTISMTEYLYIPKSKRDRSIFPIIGDGGESPPLTYKINIATDTPLWYFPARFISVTTGKYRIPNFEGKYLFVIEANGDTSDSQGKYRRISKAEVDLDVDASIINLTVEDYFKVTLEGNSTANDANQCWIQIVGIERNYTSDVWQCKDFLNEDGDTTSDLSLFSYSQPKVAKVTTENTDATIEERALSFYRLPGYALNSTATGQKNEIDIDVKLFENSPDQMNSFLVLPIENFEPISTTFELQAFGYTSPSWVVHSAGIFKYPDINVTSSIGGDAANIADKKHNTKQRFSVIGPAATIRMMWANKFTLPDYPKRFEHDSIYLGIRSRFIVVDPPALGVPDFEFELKWLRFLGDATTAIDYKLVSGEGLGVAVEDIIDYYYKTSYNVNNVYFYNVASGLTRLRGYENFEIDNIDSEEKYNSIEKVGLFFYDSDGFSQNENHDWDLYQLAVIFKRSTSIQKSIFTPFRGRIYKSTWGTSEGTSSYSSSSSSQSSLSSSSSSISLPSSSSSSSISSSSSSQSSPSSSSSSSTSCTYGNARKNGCAMIDNPVDILEHTMRLQNWSEQGEVKEWGKEYPNNPLIDVATTEGGFDYEDLDYHKTLRPARQIKEYREASTKAIAQSLCKQFFLVSYQNPLTGKESVSNMSIRSLTTPTTTITLTDIIGPIGKIVYPEVRDIYPEPIIKYAQNPASGAFEKTIQVTNTNAAVYDSSYVIGVSGSSAELLWARGKVLWEATRNVEQLPTDRSNLTWYTKDADALWYLETLYSWMGAISTDGTPDGVEFDPKKRTSFPVSYETGKDWFLTQHHNLQLPHQTNSQAIEFAIEKITKNIKKGQEKVTVQVILYGDTSELEYYVKDTMDAGTTLDDWEDSMDKIADAPTQGEDIKDSM